MAPYSWVLLSAIKFSLALMNAQADDSTINMKCWLLKYFEIIQFELLPFAKCLLITECIVAKLSAQFQLASLVTKFN